MLSDMVGQPGLQIPRSLFHLYLHILTFIASNSISKLQFWMKFAHLFNHFSCLKCQFICRGQAQTLAEKPQMSSVTDNRPKPTSIPMLLPLEIVQGTCSSSRPTTHLHTNASVRNSALVRALGRYWWRP